MYSGKVVVFGQKWFYSGRSGSTRAKLMLFGQNCCVRTKVVLFGQKWFYSGKSGCIWAKLLYSGKRCCNRAKMVVFGQGCPIRID